MKNKTLYLAKLDISLSTREFAQYIFEIAKKSKISKISFNNIKSTSRSFLDEMYVLCSKYNVKIIDIPKQIMPLYEIIDRSHRDNKLYAPVIKVRTSQKVFA